MVSRPRLLPSGSRAAIVALVAATVAATSRPMPVAAAERRLIPLERVEQVSVMVDDMTPDATTLALTRELIQADAEAQLRSHGLRVRSEGVMPALYFQVSVLCDDRDPCAIDVSSAAVQDVYLEALATTPIRAKTWYTGQIILAPRADVSRTVRNAVRGQADEFAADVAAARRRVIGVAPATPTTAAPARTSDDFGPRRGN
jgi:hypothetical protein